MPVIARKKTTKRKGRPPVPDDQRLDVRLTLPLTTAQYEAIAAEAERLQISPAELIRRTMRDRLSS